ncbi:hypothetical protein DFH08DRAFT_989052 [Mycena albidolilacea]|uniref:Uncharacterized protein n=1 Tax=Mycena albidolilacea TaxID=1033008 RepID=A0AAD6Z023_9AGAR|nr:hypothetical protein DFH08DRAFT_989052 [Mycena albidolilacea]
MSTKAAKYTNALPDLCKEQKHAKTSLLAASNGMHAPATRPLEPIISSSSLQGRSWKQAVQPRLILPCARRSPNPTLKSQTLAALVTLNYESMSAISLVCGSSFHAELTTQKRHDSHYTLRCIRPRRQQQRAQECISEAEQPCGFFINLIKQLRSIGPNRITYAELLELLPTLPNQNPQCEGGNKERFIFGLQGSAHDPKTCALTVKQDGTHEVNMGSMHGVVIRKQFVPEGDARGGQALKCVFVAVSVKGSAMMKGFVHTGQDPSLSVQRLRPSFLIVNSLDEAELAVKRESLEEFTLTCLDAKISRYMTRDVKLAASPENLPYVLDAVAEFNYFLARHSGNDPLEMRNEMRMEMYSLRGEYGHRMPNLDIENVVIDGEARLLHNCDDNYSFAIFNHSQHDLFPYLIYFEPAIYSIIAWWVPGSRTMAAPLPRMSGDVPTRLTIGYGADGGYAFQFIVPEGITSDTGFLKLLVSTKYLMRCIEQPAVVDVTVGGRTTKTERWAIDAEICCALVAVTVIVEGPPAPYHRDHLLL